MQNSIIEHLVCPICKAKLFFDKDKSRLICKADKLAYPIEDNIPVMILDKAEKLNIEEIKQYG